MSIYLVKRELTDLLQSYIGDYSVKLDTLRHAAHVVGKGYLDFKDYTENVLERLVKRKGKVYVDLEFWNYNYCRFENIDPEFSDMLIEKSKTILESPEGYSEGTVVILILLHQILLNVYKIQDLETFENYLSHIKVSKRVIKNFMINMEYRLPLTRNYLHLIEAVFDERSIFDFVLKEKDYFSFDEFKKIISKFQIKDIDGSSITVLKSFSDMSRGMKHVSFLIDLYDDIISKNDFSYQKVGSFDMLSVELLKMKVNNKNRDCYYSVVKKFLEKGGNFNVTVLGDNEMNEFVQIRRQEIREYFERY